MVNIRFNEDFSGREARIKVAGIGGGGGNAVNSMVDAEVRGDLPLVAWARNRDPYAACNQAWETALGLAPIRGTAARPSSVATITTGTVSRASVSAAHRIPPVPKVGVGSWSAKKRRSIEPPTR